ncbi:hypothetical protein D3C80_2222340 [compost metagenome]
MVDLLGITHKDDFAAFANSRYDGLDLMLGQVLRLIDNDELSGNRSASYIG